MWDMRRHLDTTPMPRRRSVIQFRYPEQAPADRAALAAQRMTLTGDRELAGDMQAWLGLNPFAKTRKLAS
jgi:hypothetical protein